MNFFKLSVLILLFTSVTAFSQKVIKHKISQGESIYGLALKYDVTEKEIYELNPKAKGSLLQLNQVISIPNKKYKAKEKPEKNITKDKNDKKDKKEAVVAKEVIVTKEVVADKKESFATHLVVKKETLYSISKKYGITMETLCELNPELKTENLKTGAKLKILNSDKIIVDNKAEEKKESKEPVSQIKIVPDTKVDALVAVANGTMIHKVQPKETLYGISRKYGVSVADLQKLNTNIKSELPIGYELIVPKMGQETTEVSQNVPVVEESKKEVEEKVIPSGNSAKADILIEKASEFLGTRYRRGGTSGEGFDCSGLMFTTFKNIDMTLPRSSSEMATVGVKVDKADAQKGDLIFFATFGGHRISHVGMVTEVLDDEIKFIHSSTQSGVTVSSTKEDYYSRTFVQINRVLSQ